MRGEALSKKAKGNHEDPSVSIIRKFLLYWFREPWGRAYVSVNIAVDASPALAYLEQVNSLGRGRLTLQHLVAGIVGRCLSEFPAANARISGGRIVPQAHVGLAMPVNLLDRSGRKMEGKSAELGLAVVSRVEERNLWEIAEVTNKGVAGERSGKSDNRLVRVMKWLGDALPQGGFDPALDLLHHLSQLGPFARRLEREFPVTAGLTNPGAAIGGLEGARMLGGAFDLPQRIFHVGTLWGISPIHQDVLAIQGKPEVRPVLPVLLIFDHRLIDGVRAGLLLRRFAELLLDPAVAFGTTGDVRGGAGSPPMATSDSAV